MHTLRLELKGTGIAISLIDPGPIATRFRENAYRNTSPFPPTSSAD